MTSPRLERNDSVLIVIDVQEKLIPVIDGQERLQENIERLIRGCNVLQIPALVTEQYVKGLGSTTLRVRQALEDAAAYRPFEKMCFSSFGCDEFKSALASLERKQLLVCGIEAHVCVYQTVSDLLDEGYSVTVIADAVSSRSRENRAVALEQMARDGARISSTEMALFELTRRSGTEEFRAISKLVK